MNQMNLGYFNHFLGNTPIFSIVPTWASSHPLSYSLDDGRDVDVSVSHWGQFHVKQTETVKLWQAIDAYVAKYPD
jgi:hypothetical protein